MGKNKKNQEFILFTSSNFPTGGAGAVYLNLFCKGMAYNGCLIKVYLTKGHAFRNNAIKRPRKNQTPDGVLYTYLGLAQRPRTRYLKAVDDILSFFRLLLILPVMVWKRKRCTFMVYLTDLVPGVFIYLTTFIFRCRMITFVPEFFNKADFPGLYGKMKWFSFIFTFNHLNKLSDGLIVFSHFLKSKYLDKGIQEEKIFVQPNLTDFEFWNNTDSEEKYTLGYSGTPGEKDGVIYLFKAISILKQQIPVSLIVIGDTPFGRSMIPWLQKICVDLDIKDQVHFTGLVEYERVKDYLSQCSITAITRPNNIQTRAGFPTKLGEYMALGKPVLATDFGEIRTYFTDKEEIILAETADPECIADKINWMLQNRGKVNEIALNGYKKAFKLLEYKTAMVRIIDFINNR
jgi:glycosyltransferase involved in cell wall biosynthesis